MPIDFSEFNEFDLEKIQEWENMNYTDEDIARWKEQGVLVDKLYEFKMKKLFLEYLRIKVQNEISVVQSFAKYDPVGEAERIINPNLDSDNAEGL